MEPAGLFFPGQFDWGWWGFLGLVVLSAVTALVRARPRDRIERTLPPSDLTVAVRVGDVLEQEGNVIVGTNDAYDTALEDDIINAATVQGQLLQKVFSGDRNQLDRVIDEPVGQGELVPTKPFGKKRRYEIGTVAVVPYGKARYFLPVFTKMSEEAPPHVRSELEWLEVALIRTWNSVNRYGQREPVHMPVIGSHMARLGLTRTLLIQVAVLSFIASSIKQSTSSQLTVWVHPNDAALVDLAALDDWLRELCAA